MKKMKKVITLFLAVAMLLSCSAIHVSATTKVEEVQIASPFAVEGVYPELTGTTEGTHYKLQNVTYTSSSNSKIKYVIETAGSAYAQMVNANSDTTEGYALRVYSRSSALGGSTASGAKLSMFIGDKTADNKYVISFDAARKDGKAEDYVALNEVGHDGIARLDDENCQWTVTPLGAGYDAGYVFGEWSHYEATLETDYDPQIIFSTYDYGILYIDNIVVKDTSGNVIFSENFERNEAGNEEPDVPEVTPTPTPEVPGEVVKSGVLPEEVFPSDETKDAEHIKLQNVTYTSNSNPNVKYVVETCDSSYAMVMNANSDTNGGTKSLRLYGKGKNLPNTNTSAKISMFIGTQTADNKYVVSFDAHRVYDKWLDYVALNEGGSDGIARFDDAETQWTKTTLGSGYDAGYSVGEWSRYEATLTTANAPQLNFSVYEYGVMFIDNIVVKDTEGNIIFAEDFETPAEKPATPDIPETPSTPGETGTSASVLPKAVYPSNETSSAEHVKMQGIAYASASNTKMKYAVTNETSSYAMVMNANSDKNGGKYSLRLYGKGINIEKTNTAVKFNMNIGTKTADNKYVISFDAHRVYKDWRDYVALNEGGTEGVARLDDTGTQWTKTTLGSGYDAGYNVGEWSRYEATLTTINDPQLNFSVSEWGVIFIDNIIVRDTSGNVIFFENFENPAEEGIEAPEEPEPEEPEGEGLIPEEMYPRSDGSIEKIQNATYMSETDENIKYVTEAEGKAYAQMIDVNSDTNGGKYAIRLYGKGTDTYVKFSMFIGNRTGDNKYVISFDAARPQADGEDYVALNQENWDGIARLDDAETQWKRTAIGSGTNPSGRTPAPGTWYRYEATLSTTEYPQLNFYVIRHGLMYLDNVVVKDSYGNIIFQEGFEYPAKEEPEVPDVPVVPDGEKTYDPIPKSAYPSDGTPNAEHYKMQNITYTAASNPNVKYVVTTKDTAFAMIMNANSQKIGGQYSLRIYGKGTNVGGTTGSAKVSFYFGQKTADNKYVISFDAYRVYTNAHDYATLNEKNWDLGACFDYTSLWNVTKIGKGYDAGYDMGEWRRYESTITTEEDPHLDISVYDYGVVFIDNIVVKDTAGNIIFKEDFEVVEIVEDVSSKINVAKFEVVEKVGDDYQVVEAASKLIANTLLKTSVKVENFTEDDAVNAVIFTALYKGNSLVSADVQKVSAAKGNEATSNSIVNIPSLNDGEYTVKVFVWDSGMNSLMNVQSLSE